MTPSTTAQVPNSGSERLPAAAIAAACAAVVATVVSIAASQLLLGLAIVLVAAARFPLRVPPVWIPLGLFLAGTLVSLAASEDPWAGRPQVRKLYLFLTLIVVATAVRKLKHVRLTILALGIAATASALWSFVQFALKIQEAEAAGRPFYAHYVGRRVTGFMSHWMTFGGEMSIVLVLLVALLLFAPPARRKVLWWTAAALIGAGLVLAFTRGMWFAAAAGLIYLVARWRAKLLLALPLLAVIGFLLAPASVQERITSVYRPHGELDSNYHRAVTWRTGVEMVQARPWLGLGPEMVGRRFKDFVPADVAPPLPEGWYGHLHNIYLQYAAERGLFVLAAFLWFAGKILRDALGALQTASQERRAVLHGCVAAMIAVLVGGVFEFNLGDSEVLMLFLAIVAFSYVPEPSGA